MTFSSSKMHTACQATYVSTCALSSDLQLICFLSRQVNILVTGLMVFYTLLFLLLSVPFQYLVTTGILQPPSPGILLSNFSLVRSCMSAVRVKFSIKSRNYISFLHVNNKPNNCMINITVLSLLQWLNFPRVQIES